MEKEETKREQEKEEGEGGRERDSWFLNKEKEKMTKGWVIGMESPDAQDKDKTNISPLQMAVYRGRAQHRRCSGAAAQNTYRCPSQRWADTTTTTTAFPSPELSPSQIFIFDDPRRGQEDFQLLLCILFYFILFIYYTEQG